MKRSHRARVAASAAAAALIAGLTLPLGTATAGAAPKNAATIDLSDGSAHPSLTHVDSASLADALVGLYESGKAVYNGEVTPQFSQTENGIAISAVIDPKSVPGLGDAFAPSKKQQSHQLSPSMTGKTANGSKVVFPTTGTLTSTFGARWGAQHNGIDVANSQGTPIVSAMDGEVISAGPAQGFGNWVRVRHDDGSIAVYGHMTAQSIQVSVGQRVTAGQQIAAIGSEGQSTGPHLHFEIWPDGATPSDPQQWFAQTGITV